MKLYEAYLAAEPLKKISQVHFSSFSLARLISKLTKIIKEEVDFYATEEAKLINEYSKKDENGQLVIKENQIIFDTIEMRDEYIKKMTELRNLEINVEKVKISEDSFSNLSDIPTPDEMEKLDCIIDWD